MNSLNAGVENSETCTRYGVSRRRQKSEISFSGNILAAVLSPGCSTYPHVYFAQPPICDISCIGRMWTRVYVWGVSEEGECFLFLVLHSRLFKWAEGEEAVEGAFSSVLGPLSSAEPRGQSLHQVDQRLPALQGWPELVGMPTFGPISVQLAAPVNGQFN